RYGGPALWFPALQASAFSIHAGVKVRPFQDWQAALYLGRTDAEFTCASENMCHLLHFFLACHHTTCRLQAAAALSFRFAAIFFSASAKASTSSSVVESPMETRSAPT